MLKRLEIYTKNKKLVFLLLTLLFFVLIFLLNRIYPLYIDDWAYSLIWYDLPGTNKIRPERVSSLLDILVSQYNHYLKWGGRSIVHAIAQLLLMINPLLKFVINTLAYTLFIYMLYLYSRKKELVQNGIYILLFLGSFILLPSFTETTLWTTGSANYLWGTLLLLLFIYPYYKFSQVGSSQKNNKVLVSILFFLFGIIAGWTNENTAISVVCVLFVYLIYLKITKSRLPYWMIFGFIGLTLGTIIILSAPGNFIRLNYYIDPTTSTPFLTTIKVGMKNIYHIYKQSPITILSLLSIGLFIQGIRTKKLSPQDQKFLIGIFMMSHLSIFVMIGTPFFPLRATFFGQSLMIICTVKLWNIVSLKYKTTINILILCIFCIFFIKSYIFRYNFIEKFGEIMDRRIDYIEAEKSKGNLNILITETIEFPKEFDAWDISSDSTHWVNNLYRDYFKINSIRSK